MLIEKVRIVFTNSFTESMTTDRFDGQMQSDKRIATHMINQGVIVSAAGSELMTIKGIRMISAIDLIETMIADRFCCEM